MNSSYVRFSKLFGALFRLIRKVEKQSFLSSREKCYLEIAKDILYSEVLKQAIEVSPFELEWGTKNLLLLTEEMREILDPITIDRYELSYLFFNPRSYRGLNGILRARYFDDEKVIIKVNDPYVLDGKALVEMNFYQLTQEIPYVTQAKEFLWLKDGPALVLERYDGDLKNLRSQIRLEKAVSLLPRLFDQLRKGLENIHYRGIHHSDLKLRNVFYRQADSEYDFFIADFDYSVETTCYERDESISTTGGTVNYFPPEKTRSKKSDYYTLGKTLIFFVLNEIIPSSDFRYEEIFSDFSLFFAQKYPKLVQRYDLDSLLVRISKLVNPDPCRRLEAFNDLCPVSIHKEVWVPRYQRLKDFSAHVTSLVGLLSLITTDSYYFVVLFDAMSRLNRELLPGTLSDKQIATTLLKLLETTKKKKLVTFTEEKGKEYGKVFRAIDYVFFHCGLPTYDKEKSYQEVVNSFLKAVDDKDTMGYSFFKMNMD